MMKKVLVGMISSALLVSVAHADTSGSKPANSFTKQHNHAVLSELPFNDRQDFQFAAKGLIAKPKSKQIKNDKGEVI